MKLQFTVEAPDDIEDIDWDDVRQRIVDEIVAKLSARVIRDDFSGRSLADAAAARIGTLVDEYFRGLASGEIKFTLTNRYGSAEPVQHTDLKSFILYLAEQYLGEKVDASGRPNSNGKPRAAAYIQEQVEILCKSHFKNLATETAQKWHQLVAETGAQAFQAAFNAAIRKAYE